ncbi:MAG: valine--tRNA ligase [Gammaproteobacteria bacterium]|jgi:valyl-tRNA synthetase|nr:valine--tRNA ligase [Gammaproteobacteria bacterium]
MEKTYSPKDIESALYQKWEQAGYFKPQAKGLPFSIMLPPPNVTGSLHMGHGFQQTLMDILIRYHRMQGDNTLWQPGTDHAGIATQMVVENQLHAKGQSRYDLGREAFVEKVWQWKAESGGNITKQMRRLGTSPDWSRERFTLDEGLSKAVKQAFISLYEDGLIYRGKRLVNWDPVMLTAVSDLEANPVEEQGSLWHIRYPLEDGSGFLVVATTRPETMLGDVAVAVHPDDERYQHLIGRMLKLPLTDRLIQIIADEYVDPSFGTGCVKITPAHDFNDYEVGKRHQLPLINIFTETAHLNENTPVVYQGLERFVARKKIVADLEALGLLEKIQPHVLKVPRNERGNAVLEPYLMDQWYVKTKPLAEPAIKAVESGKIKFIPENWGNTYFEWMHNIQDWCISRQLWWGHRIPAWYDKDNNIYVGWDEQSVRDQHKLPDHVELKQDEDVLDTWFSSALWPFSTLGWPEQTPELKNFYPTSILITGFDIIFFWVARMAMFGLHFMKEVPFNEVYITGLIRDSEGQKMSKTKGNVLDPVDLIDGIDLDSLIQKRTYGMMQPKLAEKITQATKKQFPEGIPAFGTDALRFTFCALASTSRDINFDVQRMEGYRNFCNKLWNATRFVLMNVEAQPIKQASNLSPIDHWIHAKLDQCIANAHRYLAEYRFDLLAQNIYDFVWNEYCDWYLEFAKVILNGDQYNDSQKAATRYTLVSVLEQVLRLAHPIIPFITESIWQSVAPALSISADSIMLQAYPKAENNDNDQASLTVERVKLLIGAIRALRSENNVPPSKLVKLLIQGASQMAKDSNRAFEPFIKQLGRLEEIEYLSSNDSPPPSASFLMDDIQFHIPLVGLVDVQAEIERLHKELNKYAEEIMRLEAKLANPQFADKAPEAVVAKEKEKLHKAKEAQSLLSLRLTELKSL